jgi:hypothetical protein
MFGRIQTSQVWFYEIPEFGELFNSILFIISFSYLFKERYANRLSIEGLQMFSLGKSTPPYTIAAYIKGKKVTKNFIIYFVL